MICVLTRPAVDCRTRGSHTHINMNAGLVFAAVVCVLGLARGAQVGHPMPGCGKCVPDACPKSDAECGGALVPDTCECCAQGVCGLQEGEKCYNATVRPALPEEYRKYGMCAENLFCQLRHDLSDRDEPEALCVCKDDRQACGSDGRSYESVCEMNQQVSRAGVKLQLKHWGPCNAVPIIVSAPVDTSSSLHHSITLDCEVKGSPIPTIHWEFTGDDGSHRILPSDDLYVAVQVRGGPEPYMVTSWLQIVDLRPTDMGSYSCIGTNDVGSVSASATVGVRR